MAERWTNSKGKIFTGQNASVPAPEDKSPVVVDYTELNQLSLVLTRVGNLPTQANNGTSQSVVVQAALTSGDPINLWNYNINIQDGNGSVPLTFSDVAPLSGGIGITANAVFPAGVMTGQSGIVKASSGGKIGTLTIVVA